MIVETNRYPFVAALDNKNIGNVCGGVLISPKLLLTSATCGITLSQFGGQVVLGCPLLDDNDCEVHDIQDVAIHPDFIIEKGSIGGHDLAVLHLPQASSQKPVQLPEEGLDFSFQEMSEFSWTSGQLTELIKSWTRPLTDCSWEPEPIYYDDGEYFPDGPEDPETMLCSYEETYTGFICQSNLGIPSVIPNGGKNGDLLVGVLSFPILCWQGEENIGAKGMYASINSQSNYEFIAGEAARAGESLTICSDLQGNCQLRQVTAPPTPPPTSYPTKTQVGRPVVIGTYTYTAALVLQTGEVVCGGVLIAPKMVLTSGSCGATSMFLRSPTVVLGCTFVGDRHCEVLEVAWTTLHPQYNAIDYPEVGIDVAILHLSQASQQPVVKLADPSLSSSLDYESCVNLNWETGQLTKVEESSIIDLEACDYQPDPEYIPGYGYTYHEGAPYLDERMVCTLEVPYRGFGCQSLLGSPSMIGDILVGVFSFPLYCELGEDGGTAVYTRAAVSAVYDFMLAEAVGASQTLMVCSDLSGDDCRNTPASTIATLSPTTNPTSSPSSTSSPTMEQTSSPIATSSPTMNPTTSPSESPTLRNSTVEDIPASGSEDSNGNDEVSAGVLLILAAIIPLFLLVALITSRYNLC